MSARTKVRKDTDYETRFRCAGGVGIIREEVWVDASNEVVRYNLALILPHITAIDRGRLLGFDNAHGVHERHFMGEASEAMYDGYLTTAKRFYKEAETLRRSYED